MIHGTILLDKPKNITSNKALSIIKKELSLRKAGVVGILDPLASGMLPIVVNQATKLAKFVESYEKEYLVTSQLGFTSTTGDEEGIISSLKKTNVKKINIKHIKDAIKSFLGEQKQIPPMYSGLKVNGAKLYQLARKGITIKRQPRNINIFDIKLVHYIDSQMTLNITCSKGTYIRTLIESIGHKLDVGAYTKELRRLRIGHFKENQMITFDKLHDISNHIIPLEPMLGDMKSIVLNREDEIKIRNGQKIYTKYDTNYHEIAMKNINHQLIGIGNIKDHYMGPKRLINFDE